MASDVPGGAPVESLRQPAIEVHFDPQGAGGKPPVEVLRREDLMERMSRRHRENLQRARFHQIVICVGGSGTHHVDFVPHEMNEGTLLRIRPGQVQKFEECPALVAEMVIWPVENDPNRSGESMWFPGCGESSTVNLDAGQLARVLVWVEEMRIEQERFQHSSSSGNLLRSMLTVVLGLFEQSSGSPADVAAMPQAYLDLRKLLERRVFERPTVGELGAQLGYSTRTLDRACQAVSAQTAKQVIDERVTLELRRLLADAGRSIAEVRDSFGFVDPSNFTKLVRRHLGQTPGDFRRSLGL